MSDPQSSRPTHDEALWMLTGLLVGLAIWLWTDVLSAGVGVGIALGIVLAGQERARRTHGESSRGVSDARRAPQPGNG